MTFINFNVLTNKEEKLAKLIKYSRQPEADPDVKRLFDELNWLWKRYGRQGNAKRTL